MGDDSLNDRRTQLRKALEKTVPSGEFSPRGTQHELERTRAADTPSPTPQQFLAKTKTDTSDVHDTDDQSAEARFGTTSLVPPELLDEEETEGPRFDIQGEAGRGGTAHVYRVLDRSLGRTIALKLLRTRGKRKEGVKRRFIHEARVTAMLEHPNIVPVYDIGVTDDHRVYFLMKNVTGVSVGDAIRAACDGAAVPPELGSADGCLRVVLKVCDALAFAHDKGYVHQDIKPDNIMLGSFGEVLVLDWGCALGRNERAQGKAATFGTPAYMSPEQARQEGADERSDVYCLGATLYHMLTHHHPTWSDDPNEFWDMKRRGTLTDLPREVHESIPEALLALVHKAMDPDPGRRYQSVTEFQRAIMEYQGHVESIALAREAAEQLRAADKWAEYLRTAQDHSGTSIEERALVRAYLAASQAVGADTLRAHIRRTVQANYPQSSYWPLLLQADCLVAWRDGSAGEAIELASAVLERDPDSRVALRMLSNRPKDVPPRTLEDVLQLVGKTTKVYGLSLEGAQIRDISPLAGLPIRSLALRHNAISDISALRGIPLRVLLISSNPVADLSPLSQAKLTVLEAHGCDISSLAPLTGMDIAKLSVSRNDITDIAPLAGMPLQSLDATDNHIRSCAPLAGMHTLRELALSNNPISDIRSLRDLRLQQLSLQNTAITSLEAIEGMPLRYLGIDNTTIADLSPLRGMPLTELSISRCPITSLEPLTGLPLAELEATHCSITDPGPLANAPLRSLNCAGNRIRVLPVFTAKQLTQLDVSNNDIRSLRPLEGMPLTRVVAGGNPLASLKPFEQDPPERLVFDTIVGRPGYADTVIARWERSGHARSARLSKLAIAYRRGDTDALRRLAVQHQGHRYVYVPGVALTFDRAMETAARFGGHLVSVETAEEYQLALRLLPLRRAAWLGIDFAAKPMRWLTGEPLAFDRFYSLPDRTAAVPKYMNSFARNDAAWFAAVRGTELAGLIVEWDD